MGDSHAAPPSRRSTTNRGYGKHDAQGEIAVLVSRVTKLEDEAIDALKRIRALEAKGE